MTLVKRQKHPAWPEGYRRLFQPTFVDVQGRVFALWTRSRRRIRQFTRRFKEPPTAVDENTRNHEHFWYFDNTSIEGCRKNYVLASAVRLAWQELLATQFPSRSFEIFVCNEYSIITGADPSVILYEEVTPTLRLWTCDTPSQPSIPTTQSMREVYRVDELGPEKVLWPAKLEDGLYELEAIFELIHSGPDNPLKKQVLEAVAQGSEAP